ncbi:MAG: TCR/Tet family MFS transporter [Rhodobacteraceae bacterium]|nr:TCR/Tet family MFS transporter [Paracoccaceae bacterium]
MSSRLPVIFIIITVMLDSVGVGLIMPVMPDLIRSINGATISEAAVWGGLMAFTYALTQFLFGPTIGNLSDRFGRRPVLLTSLVVMSLSYLIFALAQTIWLLVLARVLTGITGATFSTANAYMADITPPEKRAASFGLVGAAFGVGFIFGPAIGGILGEYGARAPFYAAAAVAALNAMLGLFVLPETLTPEKRRAFDFSKINPLRAILRIRNVPGVGPFVLVLFLFGVAQNVYPSVWSYFTQEQFGFSTGMVGISLAIFGLCMALVQGGLIRVVIPRFGEWRTAQIGLALNVVVLMITAMISTQVFLFVLMPVMALGVVVSPALQGLMSNATSSEHQGELQGVLASVQGLAMIFSPLIMTSLFRVFTAENAPVYLPGAPFIAASLLMVLALILLMRQPRT